MLEKGHPELKKIDPEKTRMYAEYNEIEEGKIIITIEHCSHCQQHQPYTRHDEAQYLLRAQSLRDMIVGKYPYIKVLLKPIKEMVQAFKNPFKIRLKTKKLTMDDLNIDKYRPELRLGAFEIQICTMKDGRSKVDILFSKLKTHKWPSTYFILDKISKYVPKTNLTVRLLFTDEGSNELPKDNIIVSIHPDKSKEEEIGKQFSENLSYQFLNMPSDQKFISLSTSRPVTSNDQIKNFLVKQFNLGKILPYALEGLKP